MNLDKIEQKIDICLTKLYQKDKILFERNLSERCIVFRLALYLQKEFNKYFVDCDFNAHYTNGEERHGKPITNPDGTVTNSFIDIIVHERSENYGNDFICFEVKKWNNCPNAALARDANKLKRLTSDYGYKYGFQIVFGKTRDKVKIIVFSNGEELSRK